LAKGSAPVLAVFLLGVMVTAFTVSGMLKSGYERQSQELLIKQAALTSASVLNSVQAEINLYLRTVACATMYEVGERSGDENEVTQRVTEVAKKLENGWLFPGVSLELSFDNLHQLLLWMPDGSLNIVGSVPAIAKHVMGPESHGLRIEVTALPRFRRLRQLSRIVTTLHENFPDLEDLLRELNENFRYEGFSFEEEPGGIVIRDLWAQKTLTSR